LSNEEGLHDYPFVDRCESRPARYISTGPGGVAAEIIRKTAAMSA
jgi:hypothetical protein